MTEMNVNVKAINYEGMNLGYSYKERETQTVQPDLVYLPENKFKQTLKQEFTQADKDLHYAIGFGTVGIPYALNSITSSYDSLALAASGGTGSIYAIKTVGLMKGLMPIIELVQDFALPVSILVASWGCIEWIVGSPGWKHKLKGAVIGLIAIYFIPYAFMTISSALKTLPLGFIGLGL